MKIIKRISANKCEKSCPYCGTREVKKIVYDLAG